MKRRGQGAPSKLVPALFVIGVMATAFVATIFIINEQDVLPSGALTEQSSTTGQALSTETSTSNQTTSTQASPQVLTVIIPWGCADADEICYIPQFTTVVIGVNNTVTWVNDDNAAHTVTASDGSFGSGNMGAGQTFTYTFTTPGVYDYYCAYHSWMTGIVTVKAA